MAAPTPSKEELQLANMVREKLGSLLSASDTTTPTISDNYILPFIRFKNGNLDAAEKLIKANLQWRKDFNVDKLIHQPLNEFCASNFPFKFGGRDKDGLPVVVVPIGKWDLEKAMGDEIRFRNLQNYFIQIYEKIIDEILKANEEKTGGQSPISQFTIIYDWEGFHFKQLLHPSISKRLASLMTMIDSNYPERVSKAFFINCSGMMSSGMKVIELALSEKTFGKILTLPHGKAWKEALAKVIDPDQLPPEYRGT